jgi:transposase-like protein
MALPKIYTDENAARTHLEKLLWADGIVCPHCGSVDQATLLKGKSTRPGVYKCRACAKPFSVTVGTVFERSKIPLNTWVYAVDLYTASKKGFSAHQLHRTIGVTYKTAWFMAHRIREAMTETKGPKNPMGGSGKIVEADETYYGKKADKPKVTTSGRPFLKGGWALTKSLSFRLSNVVALFAHSTLTAPLAPRPFRTFSLRMCAVRRRCTPMKADYTLCLAKSSLLMQPSITAQRNTLAVTFTRIRLKATSQSSSAA